MAASKIVLNRSSRKVLAVTEEDDLPDFSHDAALQPLQSTDNNLTFSPDLVGEVSLRDDPISITPQAKEDEALPSGRHDFSHSGTEDLIKACVANSKQDVERVLKFMDTDINALDEEGFSALMWACYNKASDIVRVLLEAQGINASLSNKRGETALMMACRSKSIECVELLLRVQDIDVNKSTKKNGITSLMVACRNRQKGIVEMLLKVEGIDVSAEDHYGCNALMWACEVGAVEIVSLLLNIDGIDVNGAMRKHKGTRAALKRERSIRTQQVVELSLNGNITVGETGLMKACKVNSPEIAKMLVDTHRVDVNAADEYGRTALIHACEQRNHELVELLLAYPGVQVNSATKSGVTALMAACALQSETIVELLLNVAGIDVNVVSETGETALLLACNSNAKTVVQLLLKVKEIDVNVTDQYGISALMSACRQNSKEIVGMLLKMEGIDVNAVTFRGETPLMQACEDNQADIVDLLLKSRGIDVNATSKEGETALMKACRKNSKGAAFLLLDTCYVDVNAADNLRRTALMWACRSSAKEIVERLLACKGIDVCATDHNGLSALMWAMGDRSKEIVLLLLETNRLDVNAVDKHGSSALLHACESKSTKSVEVLLNVQGIDVNVADQFGETPLMSACKRNAIEIVELLLRFDGININAADKDGLTALLVAYKAESEEIVRLLINAAELELNGFLCRSEPSALQFFNDAKLGSVRFAQCFENISAQPSKMDAFQNLCRLITKLYLPVSAVNKIIAVADGDSVLRKVVNKLLVVDKGRFVLIFLVTFSYWLRFAGEKLPHCTKDFKVFEDSVRENALNFLALDKFDDDRYMVALLLPNVEIPLAGTWKEGGMRFFWIRRCFTDKSGVLSFAMDKDIKWLFGNPLIFSLTNEVLISEAPFSKKTDKVIDEYSINARARPLYVLVVKCLAHLLVLLMIAIVGIEVYGDRSMKAINTQQLSVSEVILVVCVFSLLLHEVGEIMDFANDIVAPVEVFSLIGSNKALKQCIEMAREAWEASSSKEVYKLSLRKYFQNSWNYCDILTVVLLFAWFFLRLSGDVTNSHILVSLSALPCAFGFLRYFTLLRPLGQLVILIWAMLRKMWAFLVVYIAWIAGFAVTFRGLFATSPAFSSSNRAFFVFVLIYVIKLRPV